MSQANRLFDELRTGLRALRRQPGSSLLIALTIGVAAGPLVVALALGNPASLADRGVAEPDQLVRLVGTVGRSGAGAPVGLLSYPEYEYAARSRAALSDLFAATRVSLVEGDGDAPTPVEAGFVTAEYFGTLGVRFALGAAWDSAAASSGEPITVLSEAYWRLRFDSDPDVIGRELRLDGVIVRVAGVTAAGFAGFEPGRPQALWLPMRAQPLFPHQVPPLDAWDAFEFAVVGRLSTGSSVARVRADLSRGDEQLALARPMTMRERTIAAELLEERVTTARGPAAVIQRASWALALTVLALAAFNVAGILLVRSLRETHSTAVRLALGLSLRRLAVGAALQASVLSAVGLAVALVIGAWSLALIQRVSDGAVAGHIGLSTLLVAFAILLVFAAIMAFVPVTAWREIPLNSVLASGGRTEDVGTRRRTSTLVALQVAVSGVVACAALMLGRGIESFRRADPGFATVGLWSVAVDLRRRGAPLDRAALDELKRSLPRVIAELPGVEGAGLARMPLLLHAAAVTAQVSADGGAPGPVAVESVGPGYFEALGVGVVSGTALTSTGVGSDQDDVVINRNFADRQWPAGGALGRMLHVHSRDGEVRPLRVVGVVEDFRSDFVGRALEPRLFRPALHVPFVVGFLYVRGPTAPEFGVRLEREITRILADPVTPPVARPVDALREESLAFLKNAFLVASALTVLAITLAIGGVFGLQSFAAVQRRREFGIRLALGARRTHIVRLMFTDAALAVLTGLLFATPVVVVSSRLLSAIVPGFASVDAVIVLWVLTVLLAVVLAGSAWPTAQALKSDPLVSIREGQQ